MPEPLRVRYVAAATLSRFLDSNARIRTVVGPFGSGKSSACIMELLARSAGQEKLKDGKRRTRWAVIRNTYRELEDTTRKTFEKWMQPPDAPNALGRWRESDFAFDLRFGDVEAEILFRALDRPEHIKKLLSLDLTGAYVNEAREIPKHIFDALDGRIGRYPAMDEGGPSWNGIWQDSNPWHVGHWIDEFYQSVDGLPRSLLEKLGYSHPREYAQIFRQPGGREPNAENTAFLPPGYYDRLCIGKDQEWIDVYVDGKDAKGAIGSIYGALVAELEKDGGVYDFEHDCSEVFTSWDLGHADATAIWFWRILGRDRIEVVDYYENNFKKLPHYFEIVEAKGYDYKMHWLPHDAASETLGTDLSIEDQCRERWPNKVTIGPRLSIEDGIAATRWLLEKRARFHKTNCADGLKALKAYRRKWDPVKQVFSEPIHDWASNGADAARYMAVTVRATELLMRKPEGPPVATPADMQAIAWLRQNPSHPKAQEVAEYLESKGLYHAPKRPTLDELWKTQGGGTRERV
jgi:hypothetical protein